MKEHGQFFINAKAEFNFVTEFILQHYSMTVYFVSTILTPVSSCDLAVEWILASIIPLPSLTWSCLKMQNILTVTNSTEQKSTKL